MANRTRALLVGGAALLLAGGLTTSASGSPEHPAGYDHWGPNDCSRIEGTTTMLCVHAGQQQHRFGHATSAGLTLADRSGGSLNAEVSNGRSVNFPTDATRVTAGPVGTGRAAVGQVDARDADRRTGVVVNEVIAAEQVIDAEGACSFELAVGVDPPTSLPCPEGTEIGPLPVLPYQHLPWLHL